MSVISPLFTYAEDLYEDAVGTAYEDSFKMILVALQKEDIKLAQELATNMISGADEDRAWDSRLSNLIFALDGTLERLGIPL